MNKIENKKNIEIISGIPVDCDKFKSKAKGWNLEQVKQGYISFCELLYKNNHELLSDYVDNKTKVLIDFNCGHKPHWITPQHYRRGIGCPKCSGNCPEQAKEELINLINKNGHKLLSEYVNASTEVLIDFNCRHEPHWIVPYNYKRGRGCPKCLSKYGEQVKEDFMNLINKNRHKLLSEYVNTTTKVLIDFNCGHEPHWIVPYNYKRGKGCPRCKK